MNDTCPVESCPEPRGQEGRRRLPVCEPHWHRVAPASRAWWHCAMNVGTADDLHDAQMTRDEALLFWECPVGDATIADEDVARLADVELSVIRVTGCRE